MTTDAFAPTSRYFGLPTLEYQRPDGTKVVYVARRLIPGPERFAVLSYYTVTTTDRLDLVAARLIGDPEQFWRLCDANAALAPESLTDTPGARIAVTLPNGIPGPRRV